MGLVERILYNGIHIIPGKQTQTENYRLNNNQFYEIQTSANATWSEVYWKVAAWSIPDHRGAAIYCNPTYMFASDENHKAHIL